MIATTIANDMALTGPRLTPAEAEIVRVFAAALEQAHDGACREDAGHALGARAPSRRGGRDQCGHARLAVAYIARGMRWSIGGSPRGGRRRL